MSDDTYEPFRAMKERTLCPFARTATLEYGPHLAKPIDLPSVAKIVTEALVAHMQVGRSQRLGGYVLRLPSSGTSFESDVRDFATFIDSLAKHDASCRKTLEEDMTAEGWSLKINDEPIFLNFFSSKYTSTHSKYIGSPENFWIFFQPEYVFEQHRINRGALTTKTTIRRAFTEAGMQYDFSYIDARKKAFCFVFPLRIGDPPVEWWRHIETGTKV